MPSRGATISTISVGLAIFGIIFVGISFMTIDDSIEDNDELIYIGTQDEVHLSIDNTYAVYVSKDSGCSSVDVSVSDGVWEYFSKNCESYQMKGNLRYIGSVSVDSSGTYSVDSITELRIYESHAPEIDAGFIGFIIIGEGFCCFSILGLTIGIVLLFVDKNNNQNVFVIPSPQNAMGYQQPITPAPAGVIMSSTITTPSPENTLSNPSAAIKGILGADGYEWLDYGGTRYWRPQGSNSTWYPHKLN
jgi:hypothetical protein